MSIKVLWLSNVDLSESLPTKSGTWIYSMYNALKASNDVFVCANITFSNNHFQMKKVGDFHQYYLSSEYIADSGYPNQKAFDVVCDYVNNETPDIIHIWGTERAWPILALDERLKKYKKLLEIQGLISTIAEENVFYGGLSKNYLLRYNGLLELIYRKNRLSSILKKYRSWGIIEKQILTKFRYIDVQSSWIETIVCQHINKSCQQSTNATIFRTGIILRNSFLHATRWHRLHEYTDTPIVLTTTSSTPYKGLHVTLRAFSILCERFPNARLRIAGITSPKSRIKSFCYSKYINNLLDEYNIRSNVDFLGNLDEYELLNQMYLADVFVVSSYVESFCLALAEALAIGLPSVSSYAAALPELISDGNDGFLYPIGDYRICASHLNSIITNKQLANKISENSSSKIRKYCSEKTISQNQISIYKKITSHVSKNINI